MKKFLLVIGILLVIGVVFMLFKKLNGHDYVDPENSLKITSDAFEEGGMIPVKYTGKGEDISPSLNWGKLDPKAKTVAIILDDLDTPMGVFNHWVIWNIPASLSGIPEGVPKEEVVKSLGNAVQGKSGYGGKHYYRGPLPPFGTHRYVFKVYVLDTVLDLDKDTGKEGLQKAMKGHILQYGTLMGKFGA